MSGSVKSQPREERGPRHSLIRGQMKARAARDNPKGYLKYLDAHPASRSEACVPSNEAGPEFFRQRNVGRIVSRQIMPAPPNLRQENEVGIARDPKIE